MSETNLILMSFAQVPSVNSLPATKRQHIVGFSSMYQYASLCAGDSRREASDRNFYFVKVVIASENCNFDILYITQTIFFGTVLP